MKLHGSLLVLALAVPAPAQTFISADQADGIAFVAQSARTLREKLKPASVDPKLVRTLTDRLIKDGVQIVMERGIGHGYTRIGQADTQGRVENLQVTLVEVPSTLVEIPGDTIFRKAVLNRYFSHLEVIHECWAVNPQTGNGTVHAWAYMVSLEGVLLSVEHAIASSVSGEVGQAEPDKVSTRSYRLSPSDPSVQRRWKELIKELMTLGVVEA